MDTVPPFLGPCREDAENLYGRGTCDAKGIIAAHDRRCRATPLRQQSEGRPPLCSRRRARLRRRPQSPTSNPAKAPASSSTASPQTTASPSPAKAALRVELRAHGKMAHSAYPELGESAIDKLLAVTRTTSRPSLSRSSKASATPPSTSASSQGGYAPNVIADKPPRPIILIRLVGPAEEIKAGHRPPPPPAAARRQLHPQAPLHPHARRSPHFDTMIAKFTTDIPSLTALGRALPPRPRQHPRSPHAG